MASPTTSSRPRSVPRYSRTDLSLHNPRVTRISLWRLATQKPVPRLEALRCRWESPAGNAVSTHGCGWSWLYTSTKNDRVGIGRDPRGGTEEGGVVLDRPHDGASWGSAIP